MSLSWRTSRTSLPLPSLLHQLTCVTAEMRSVLYLLLPYMFVAIVFPHPSHEV